MSPHLIIMDKVVLLGVIFKLEAKDLDVIFIS
jgi:hypothetical protein